MKYIPYFPALLAAALMLTGCTDETLVGENASSGEDINIEQFSEGYSLAFDMKVGSFGDSNAAKTRANTANITDADIEEWENYINPQEFRILFFDSQDRFLFESKSRWLTQIPTHDGGRRWRVGVPVFQYLSDGFDENVSEYQNSWVMDDAYNWDRIAEIMRTEPFKIAILANRQSDIALHTLSDLSEEQKKVRTFGKNGPFWGPKNSRASYDNPDDEENKKIIRNVFDLHHCQYDPYYENKSNGEGQAYDFIMEYADEELKDGEGLRNVPHMGAISDWIHPDKKRVTMGNDNTTERNHYRLPKSRIVKEEEKTGQLKHKYENLTMNFDGAPDQYIPMYGIQVFEPLNDWKKGTTYYLSEQSGSQTAEYNYKSISLLRSVVKLELRIPMYDQSENEIRINHTYAHICASNIMARNEPMDIWTPTEQIWKADHKTECEWNTIKNYLYCEKGNDGDYKRRLSWFFGAWDKDGKWPIELGENGKQTNLAKYWDPDDNDGKEYPYSEDYPRIFNPITQRLQRAMITDCYLPIINEDRSQCYHRWIVYCGEKNMNDPNNINNLSSTPYILTFRVQVLTGTQSDAQGDIYNLAITDYSKPDNPIWNFYKETTIDGANVQSIEALNSYPSFLEKGQGAMNRKTNNVYTSAGYYVTVREECSGHPEYWPYPLLRNHHYRLTLNLTGNGNDVDVQVMDGDGRIVAGNEERTVGGIEFN